MIARIVRGTSVVLSWWLLVHLQVADPVALLCMGTALLLAGPIIRLAVRPTTPMDLELPAAPSRFSTLTAASCLSVTKAALASGLLARRTDRLADRS